MSLFHAALQPALDSDGNPISGATWNFYETGTLTPANVYSTAALDVSLGSTVTANAAGRFDTIFFDDGATIYRAILKDAGGTTLKDIDPANDTQEVIDPGTITVPASVGGSAKNVGLTVSMPTTGTGQDVGVHVVGGTGVSSGKMAVFEKNRSAGSDFMQFLEYDASGNYYFDDGTQAEPNVISLRIGNAAQIETRKWVTISGTVNLNGSPADPFDPAHNVTFVPPSEAPMMLGVNADLDIAFSTALPELDPQPVETAVHWSVIGNAGGERLALKKQGNWAYMDNWTPDATNGADRPDHIDFEVGRVNKFGFGAQAGGFMCLNTCTLADLTAGTPDPVDLYLADGGGRATAGAVIVTDAGTPGLYYSNGRQFCLSTNAATTVGPDRYGWTTATALNAGEAITETSLKNFEKTGGTASWNSTVYTTATQTGDQLTSFTVDDTAGEYIVGIGTAIPSGAGDNYFDATQGNMTGVKVSGGIYFACVAGTVDSVTQLRSVVAGDKVVIRKVSGVVTLEVNSDLVATLTGAAPNVAYYGMAAMRTVNSTIASLGWRVLS